MKNFRRITMNDIARQAGVSRPAVSAALSGNSTIVLSAETREKIKRVANELGYRPSMLARIFSHQKSFLIGFIGTEEHHLYMLDTIRGIEEVLEMHDYSLVSFYKGDDASDQSTYLDRCLDRQIDGVIIAAAPKCEADQRIEQIKVLRKRGVPVVQIYRKIFSDIPYILTDDREVGRTTTRYLLDLGHRRIAHYTTETFRNGTGYSVDALQRYNGYCDAMREAGLQPITITHRWSSALGYANNARTDAMKVASHPAKITAVTCYSDFTAIGLLNGLADGGVAVPKDISVVGFDNISACEFVNPPLTTFCQPSKKIGEVAAQMVFAEMSGERAKNQEFPPVLIARASTSRLRSANKPHKTSRS